MRDRYAEVTAKIVAALEAPGSARGLATSSGCP